jgi:hypothetical protein
MLKQKRDTAIGERPENVSKVLRPVVLRFGAPRNAHKNGGGVPAAVKVRYIRRVRI